MFKVVGEDLVQEENEIHNRVVRNNSMKIQCFINQSRKLVRKDDIMAANQKMAKKNHIKQIAIKDEELRKERRRAKGGKVLTSQTSESEQSPTSPDPAGKSQNLTATKIFEKLLDHDIKLD